MIGDYGSGNDHEWAVGRTLAAERPDFVTTAGDNSYLVGAPQVLDRNIFDPLHDVMLGAPLWATEGEHDLIYSGGAAVTSALHLPGPRGRYAVRYGPVQLVLLGLEAGASEIAFARRELAVQGPLVRFVVVHRPVQPGNPICRFCAGRASRPSSQGTCTATSGDGRRHPRVHGRDERRGPRGCGVHEGHAGRRRIAPRLRVAGGRGVARRDRLYVRRRARARSGQLVRAMRWPRVALGLVGAIATAAALLVQEPQVFAITGIAGIVAVVLAAGCLAADAIPYRPVHAAAAALSIVDAVVLAVGGRAVGIPVLVPALVLLLLQLAPAANARWLRRGPRPGFGS